MIVMKVSVLVLLVTSLNAAAQTNQAAAPDPRMAKAQQKALEKKPAATPAPPVKEEGACLGQFMTSLESCKPFNCVTQVLPYGFTKQRSIVGRISGKCVVKIDGFYKTECQWPDSMIKVVNDRMRLRIKGLPVSPETDKKIESYCRKLPH